MLSALMKYLTLPFFPFPLYFSVTHQLRSMTFSGISRMDTSSWPYWRSSPAASWSDTTLFSLARYFCMYQSYINQASSLQSLDNVIRKLFLIVFQLHGFKKSSHRIFRLNNIAKVLSFLEERNVSTIANQLFHCLMNDGAVHDCGMIVFLGKAGQH